MPEVSQRPTIQVHATLFLCGGATALAHSAGAFAAALGGGRVALLLEGGAQLERYVPRYVRPWLAHGLSGYDVIAPDAAGRFDAESALEIIRQADGVFVGGGNTAVYHRLYAAGPIGEMIRQRCLQGMPYGGMSAGMLIAGQVCPLDPEETGEKEVRLVEGLGLFGGVLLEPHFSAQNQLNHLEAYLALSGIAQGWGVDDRTCVVLRPGQEPEVIGGKFVVVTKSSPGSM